jgi:hypothetical protein
MGRLTPPHPIRIFKVVGSGASAQSLGCKDKYLYNIDHNS